MHNQIHRQPASNSATAGALKTLQVPRRFVTNEWGGTETVILKTSQVMLRAGHEASIHTSLALSSQERETLQGVDVQRYDYGYPFWGLAEQDVRDMDRKGGNLLSLSLLHGLLREQDVDNLHAHSGKRLGGIVRTAARLRGIPYVVTLHGGHFDVPTGEMEQMLQPIRRTVEWGKPFGALLGSRRVLQDAAAVICVGQNEYDQARAALPGQRVELLPNGVDSEFFAHGDGAAFRASHGIPADRKVILCVSRIDYQKNQAGLVEAMPEVLTKHPDSHLVLLGPVTVDSYRDRLLKRIRAVGVGERVTLLPGLPPGDSQLADAYHAADLFCLPSLHEPCGIVVLEAWAAGLPVVASYVGGIPSFTENGRDVRHVAPAENRSIAAGIIELLDHPEQANRLAGNGRLKARNEYDWNQVTERLLAIYRDVIGRQS